MANSPNIISRTVSLADFLALVVSDGDQADVYNEPKIDDPTLGPTPASQIKNYAGQLWSNGVDDAVQRVIQMYYGGTKLWQAVDAAARDALGSDDDLAVNDVLLKTDDYTLWYCATVLGGSSSTWAPTAATGTVVGPGGPVIDNEPVVFDGVSGALIKGGTGILIDPTGNVTGISNISLSGFVDGRDVALDGANQDSHIASISNPHTTSLAQVLAAGDQTNGSAIEFTAGDPLTFNENATVPGGVPGAGEGKVWVRNDVPNTLIFTNDIGVDVDIGSGTTDTNAVHVNVANELSIIANKATPAGADFLLIEDSAAAGVKKHILVSSLPTGGAGSDTTAIHDNVAAEISAVALKVTPVVGDYLLIEDSAAGDAKKRITIGSLPTAGPGSDTTAIHDDTASEISAIANKPTPAGGDFLLIEDSAAGNIKKHILVSSLPTGGAGSDSTAIHDNVAAEISAVTLKATPVSGDFLLIEDSAAGDAKKRITIGTLPGTSTETLAATLIAGNTTGGTNLVLTSGDKLSGAPGSGAAGGTAAIIGGTGAATFAGGPVDVTGGSGATTGAGGLVTIRGGTPGATGVGGAVVVQGGPPTDGNGGGVSLSASSGVGTNRQGGAVVIGAGSSTGSADGGDLNIQSGSNLTAGSNGGALSIIAGYGGGGGTGGELQLFAGSVIGTGQGGHVILSAGATTGAGTGGNIILTPGSTTGGTAGQTTIYGLKTTVDRIQHTLGGTIVAGDFAISAGWGTTAAISAVAGTDSRFMFTLTSGGTGQAANPTITVTYGDGAWPVAPFPMISDDGSLSGVGALLNPVLRITTRTTTQAVWTLQGAVAPVAGDVFRFIVHVMG